MSDTTIAGYADDHVFTHAFMQKDTLVKHGIEDKEDRIKNRMCMNHLQMNDTKTEHITFGTSNLFSKKDLVLYTGGFHLSCTVVKLDSCLPNFPV